MTQRFFYAAMLSLCLLASKSVDVKKVSALKGESTISYSFSHPLHKIEATSKEFVCDIDVAETQEIQSVKVVVDVMTFDSGNSSRDSHAMEVIDALSFPEITFVSESISIDGEKMTVKGKLSFHGESKPIAFACEKISEAGKIRVIGKMTVKLADFKVERPQLALIRVDENLYISFSVVFAL
jgi:polyisoprenoid-binding protein YceI